MQTIIISAIITSVVGILIGLFLGIFGEKFKVETDEREEAVRNALPGNNCGGCGYAGCDALAKAIVVGEAPTNACPVGQAKVANEISKIMGVESVNATKKVAFVKCQGDCNVAKTNYNYVGIKDCRIVKTLPNEGAKGCNYGCLGYGTCKSVCEFGAIEIINGVAVIDKEKCTACGKCKSVCPRHLIEIVPYDKTIRVACNSHDKGKDVKSVCATGCIGCTLCTKQCEEDAISVDNFLAHIDYDKCVECGKCMEKCPSKIIKKF